MSGEDAVDTPPDRAGPASRPPTSIDVARLAGVSRATVSHVLNNQNRRFSTATIERVRSAAATLGYVPSAAGRALVTGRSDFVVVVVPYATLLRLQDVIDALSREIGQLGLCMIAHFSSSRDDRAASQRLRHLVETLRPAGVINLGGMSAQDRAAIEGGGCAVLPKEVSAEVDTGMALLQARHLHSRGYRRLAYAFLADARDEPYGLRRAEAVGGYCADQGLPPVVLANVPMEADGAARALADLLERSGSPVGVACYNDAVGLALVYAAQRMGLSVPGDVGVIGLEGSDVGRVVSPRLTTVAGDVDAVMHAYRVSLADSFDSSAPAWERLSLVDSFAVLPGETT